MSLADLRKILQETQRQEKKDLTLEQIKVGLPIKTQRELATALVPISKGEKMLRQQDLSHFWEQCERALNGLNHQFFGHKRRSRSLAQCMSDASQGGLKQPLQAILLYLVYHSPEPTERQDEIDLIPNR